MTGEQDLKIGTVTGSVWATRKATCLSGQTFLVIKTPKEDLVAADQVGAGIGDRVLLVTGSDPAAVRDAARAGEVLELMGNDGIISYTIIGYVNTMVVMTMVGVSQGTQPLVSYHRGKGDAVKCRTLLRYALTTTATIIISTFVLLFVLARPLVGLFLHDVSAETFNFAVSAFRSYIPCFVLMGFNVVISGYLIALERPTQAIVVSLGRGFVVQSACLLLLAWLQGGNAIWFAPLISEAICLSLALIFLRGSKGKELQ